MNYNIDDSLNWLRGNHSFTFGGSFTQLTPSRDGYNNVPTIASAWTRPTTRPTRCSTPTNFPGASTARPEERARALRAADRPGHRRSPARRASRETGSEYVYLGPRTQRGAP